MQVPQNRDNIKTPFYAIIDPFMYKHSPKILLTLILGEKHE